ncbi:MULTISPECIES: S8 family serine peptidase [unclassified Delftia]|uniref:S8 family serine peptidase n=1 Tax=unclassified Delftia TaxID=2613839 RepID=UPI0018FFE94F|nr:MULTISPECIES: S8 family serine peptidase [unclassified Delftia]MBK0111519.1 S8 family serine peptidase [Delftia sp. S65]MBK0116662.1 S8 family serine peptidase [Delftia sp. S67]MBK0128237.1 S8 family serine peptidase [Delftia sp. S66]
MAEAISPTLEYVMNLCLSPKLLAIAIGIGISSTMVHADVDQFPYKEKPLKLLTKRGFEQRSSSGTDSLYRIHLNPFVLQKIEMDMVAAGINESSTNNNIQRSVRYVAEKIHNQYTIQIESITSWVAPVINARMAQSEAEKLILLNEVSGIHEEEAAQNDATFSQAVGDIYEGNEVVSWVKSATNTNDSITTNNKYYLIDQPPLVYTNEINFIDISNESSPTDVNYHVIHIAGLIGGMRNNSLVRGINPGQPIKAYGMAGTDPVSKLDEALRNADLSDDFAVASVSVNMPPGIVNTHSWDKRVGWALRAASNRFFIALSSGNFYGGIPPTPQNPDSPDACQHAYNYQGNARVNDGIMVVGGLNRSGARWSGGDWEYQPLGYKPDNSFQLQGSTIGPCIEAWAPAHEITSTSSRGGIRISSGTSYSAPIVAAIASRYGNSQTRPIERETYIRNSLQPTGYVEAGIPLKKVVYTAPSTHSIPKRLPIVSATSPTNPVNVHTVYDGRFYDINSYWNAGAPWGEITVDLGSIKTVTSVRLTMRSHLTPDNGALRRVNFAVWGGSSSNAVNTNLAYFDEPDHSDLGPVHITLPTTSTRYVKIQGNSHDSWLAFAEIEVYGY